MIVCMYVAVCQNTLMLRAEENLFSLSSKCVLWLIDSFSLGVNHRFSAPTGWDFLLCFVSLVSLCLTLYYLAVTYIIKTHFVSLIMLTLLILISFKF